MPAVASRREQLHRRALRLEYFTVGWNVVEGVVAVTAGLIAGSVALVGFGANSGIEVISAVALLWRLKSAGPHARAVERGRQTTGTLRSGRDSSCSRSISPTKLPAPCWLGRPQTPPQSGSYLRCSRS